MKEKICIPCYMVVKEFVCLSVSLSVVNLDLNYLRTGEIDVFQAEITFLAGNKKPDSLNLQRGEICHTYFTST